jgi:hypothetical protein
MNKSPPFFSTNVPGIRCKLDSLLNFPVICTSEGREKENGKVYEPSNAPLFVEDDSRGGSSDAGVLAEVLLSEGEEILDHSV